MLVLWICLLSWLPSVIHADLYSYRACYPKNNTRYCFIAIGVDYQVDKTGNVLLANYSTAVDWCRHQTGRLVTIEDEAKHEAVMDFILDHEYNSHDIWIDGGQMNNNVWTWLNGTAYNGKLILKNSCKNESIRERMFEHFRSQPSSNACLVLENITSYQQ